MGSKKQKVKKKCCEKYLKSGKHCKSCPVLLTEETKKNKSKTEKRKTEKKAKAKKEKKKKEKK